MRTAFCLALAAASEHAAHHHDGSEHHAAHHHAGTHGHDHHHEMPAGDHHGHHEDKYHPVENHHDAHPPPPVCLIPCIEAAGIRRRKEHHQPSGHHHQPSGHHHGPPSPEEICGFLDHLFAEDQCIPDCDATEMEMINGFMDMGCSFEAPMDHEALEEEGFPEGSGYYEEFAAEVEEEFSGHAPAGMGMSPGATAVDPMTHANHHPEHNHPEGEDCPDCHHHHEGEHKDSHPPPPECLIPCIEDYFGPMHRRRQGGEHHGPSSEEICVFLDGLFADNQCLPDCSEWETAMITGFHDVGCVFEPPAHVPEGFPEGSGEYEEFATEFDDEIEHHHEDKHHHHEDKHHHEGEHKDNHPAPPVCLIPCIEDHFGPMHRRRQEGHHGPSSEEICMFLDGLFAEGKCVNDCDAMTLDFIHGFHDAGCVFDPPAHVPEEFPAGDQEYKEFATEVESEFAGHPETFEGEPPMNAETMTHEHEHHHPKHHPKGEHKHHEENHHHEGEHKDSHPPPPACLIPCIEDHFGGQERNHGPSSEEICMFLDGLFAEGKCVNDCDAMTLEFIHGFHDAGCVFDPPAHVPEEFPEGEHEYEEFATEFEEEIEHPQMP